MFFLPQPTIGVMPTGPSIVALDAWGQQTVQQPVQFFNVVPTYAAAAGANLAGIAQGVAGLALGAGAAWGGNRAENSRRTRRQRRQAPAKEDGSEFIATDDEEFLECEPSEAFDDMTIDLNSAMDRATTQQSEEMQKLLVQLETDGEIRQAAIDGLRGRVVELAFDAEGCRALQFALEVASQKDAADLAFELVGHVRDAIESKHANYVVQKIVEVLPTSMTNFVGEEILGAGGEVARHRYGCRIICRLLEHSATERGTYALINELLMDARDLSRHAYGYHVMRCILEHGLPDHRRRVAKALCGGLQRNSKHRHASFVVEKALAFCDEPGRQSLKNELMGRPENIVDLARHQYGRHVVSQLTRLPECGQQAIDTIRFMKPQVQTTKHGRRLLEQLRPCLEGSATA